MKVFRIGGKRVCCIMLAGCLSAMLIAAAGIPRQAHAEAAQQLVIGSINPHPLVERQVRAWIAQLSAVQPFDAWKQATPSIHPLGPGTHSWLATLKSKAGQIVGYMVVHAAPDGKLHLGEYGVGPHPLFDADALGKTLLENGLTGGQQPGDYVAVPLYIHPFAAAWHVLIGQEQFWVDAKTYELLPLEASDWNDLIGRSQSEAAESLGCELAPEHAKQPALVCGSIEAIWIGETFDAYERLPWVSGQQPADVSDMKKTQRLIQGNLRLKYVSEPFGKAALYAVPVIGFIRFSGGRLDLALDMSGSRFVPLTMLQRSGQFYD